MKYIISVLVGSVCPLLGLQHSPWLYSPFEFHTGADFYANFFSDVNNGYDPFGYHSNNYGLLMHVVAPLSPNWDVELEVEFEGTSRYSFGFESTVLQGRWQFLDDVQGDIISLTGLGNIRAVPMQRLHDVATPYHNLWNFELGLSLGKEFTANYDWYLRTFLFSALGQANRGYPWISFLYKVSGKVLKCFVLEGFVDGYFGLGNQTLINVKKFDSYAYIRHQSVDVGVTFSYLFAIWGKLTLEYAYRAYAKSYPENCNSVALRYDLPFSF